MSIAQLNAKHIFGFKGDVRDSLHYIDDQTIIFPAGHNVVIYNTEQKTQRFIAGTEKTEGISALALSPNKRYVAIAERADKGMITIFDLVSMRRRKVLITVETASREYVSLSFSQDSKILLAQGGSPDWTLVYWNWEKAKALAWTKASSQSSNEIYNCTICPGDPTLCCVSGAQVFKIFRYINGETAFKTIAGSVSKREPQIYTHHAWISDDKMLLGTEPGEIHVVENGEVKVTIPPMQEEIAITYLVPYSKGFVAGCDMGQLQLFEKTDDKDMFRRSKSVKVEGSSVKIRSVAMTPTEDSIVVALQDNQLYMLSLASSDILKSDEMSFEPLSQAFHSQQITGMDTCVRKPLVVTCSPDKSVRVWNYKERTMEVARTFSDECYSVSFHPSGLHLVAGFSDKVRLMNLLMDDIRPYKEFAIKGCRCCLFSNGGHFFAAVNGNTIQIFSFYTAENIGNLRGHNGRVQSLFWTPDDSRLISCGVDGAVYEWKLKDFKRDGEVVQKSCNYSSAVCTPDMRSIFACGSDKKLKEIQESTISKEFEDKSSPSPLTQLAISHSGRLLFAGTDAGTIRSYKFPLTGDFQEYQTHAGSISSMRMSSDDTLLFSVSVDGSLMVSEVKDKEGRAMAKREKDFTFAEEVLVTRTDLEEKNSLTQELKQKVEELTMQNEYQLRLKDLNYQESIKSLTEKYTVEADAEKTRYELLLQEKNDMEMEYEDRLKAQEETHTGGVQQIEAQYQQKIMAEVERYHQLLQDKELLNERWDEQNAQLVEDHEQMIQELTEDYENRLQEDQLMMERLQAEKDELLKEFEETKRQLEEDADREIEELKEKYENKLSAEREQCLRLKGENGIMKKKFNALQKDIEDQKEELKKSFEEKKELYQHISTLEKEIIGLKKEIKERDETIGDKEKRIYDLKKKNQELEKFKFVLDYKIKELKKQIEPREMEIQDMKDQIRDMDQELERYHKNNANLELKISDLTLKGDGLQKEILSQRQKLNDSDARYRRLTTEIHDTVQFIQDPKKLKESVKSLYQRYVTKQVQEGGLDTDIQKEYNRQREYLEKSVESLKRKLSKDSENHRAENLRIMQENVVLIKEINELRRELKLLKQDQRSKAVIAGAANKIKEVNKEAVLDFDPLREIEMQREEIRRLRERIRELENTSRVSKRPKSREKLPPMDGFSEEEVPNA